MEQRIVKITSIERVTHDVLKIVTEKPENYRFTPGQATEVSIYQKYWMKKKRPFTFTSLPDDDYLEFTIKTYMEHKGLTMELLKLKKGDKLILHKVFGAIEYKGEGVFIAGGAGVTPFISIFRDLQSKNEIGDNILLFANKTKADIISEDEFRKILGGNFINILSDEKIPGNSFGHITKHFLETQIVDLDKRFYLCGPPRMMAAVEKQLASLLVDERLVVKEAF